MRKTEKDVNEQDVSIRNALQPVLKGLGFSLIELSVSRHRGSVQIRAVIYNNGKSIGTDDCSKVHRAIMPRLELAFRGQEPQPSARTAGSREGSPPDIYLEVSSPGIDRLIKDESEFAHYLGRKVRCYRTDITEWTAGILESADEKGIKIKTNDGNIARLEFDIIAKARLAGSEASNQM